MKRKTWLAILAVVGLVVGTTVVVSWSRGWFSSCDIAESVAPDAGSVTPEGGELRVVEQGLTYDDHWRAVSFGAVLENTSETIAYHTRITFSLLGADNQPITGYDTSDDMVPVVMPGQRIGIGTTTLPTTAEKTVVTEVRVGTETAQWLPVDALGDDFAPAVVEYRGTFHREAEALNATQLRFVTTSESCRPLVGWAPVALFRDSSGALVGGTREYVQPINGCANPGKENWVTSRWHLPEAADNARTALYPYCDIQTPPNPRLPREPAPTSR